MKKKLDIQHSVLELDNWLSILDTLRHENNVLKNSLADAVQKEIGRPFVEEAELFQQNFVDKDQMIELLRHDIVQFLIQLKQNELSGTIDYTIDKQITTLKKDIQKTRSGFDLVKASFNLYLLRLKAQSVK